MPGVGTTTVNFGSAIPGRSDCATVVTGIAGIASGAYVEAFVMAEATADHSADEHSVAPIRLTCGSVVAGTGFTIYAVCDWPLRGSFNVRYVWN